MVNSTLKCNTQPFRSAEVARLVEISIRNMQKQLEQVMGFTPGSKRSYTVLHFKVESAVYKPTAKLIN